MAAHTATPRYPRSAWLVFAVVAVLSVLLGRVLAHATQAPSHRAVAPNGVGVIIAGTSQTSAIANVQRLSPLIVSGSSPHGLAPGVTRVVNVKVKNPNGVKILILKARVVVGDASEGCRAHPNIRTTMYLASVLHAHRYVVPKHGKILIPLTITMRNLQDTGIKALGTFVSGNQNACKGVRFPLTYKAVGKRV